MKQILIAGTNELARYYARVIQNDSNMNIIAMIQKDKETDETSWQGIPIYHDVSPVQAENIDYIFFCEAVKNVAKCKQLLESNPILLNRTQLQLLQPFVESFTERFYYMELILNNIRDGLVIVDAKGIVQFINDTAKHILNINAVDTRVPVSNLIPGSRLPKVLQHQEKEVNERLQLENGTQIISNRVPLTNKKRHLIGAFAAFKDSNEIIRIAEENTDLKEVKTMLEAIIHSSDEPISVVDENARGLMVNPAYTRITGLAEDAVIDQPATVDIYEGESVHIEVLHSRRPIRGAKMKVGPHKKEVIVNASPIIVHGKLKGSVAVIHDVSEIRQLTTALRQAKQMIRNLEATYTFHDIIGNSPEMMIAIEQAKIGARTPATVLLRGASGTGKELFAHAIHNESERKYYKFIRVNCAAIAESVLESELFGYEEGAFTGAKQGGKKGFFEEADKGSIFLDEIGGLSLQMQVKLLRVLQEKEVIRVGGTEPIPLDIRIITATNTNLEKAITNQEFREDLYYRLNRLPVHIPSLKERMDDLPDLVHHLIMKVNQQYGRNVTSISDAALEKLRHYDWPGNIRELENVISRAVIFMKHTEEVIDYHHLPKLSEKETPVTTKVAEIDQTLQEAVETFEKNFILRVYEAHAYNKTKTAEALGISVRNLYYKLDKYE